MTVHPLSVKGARMAKIVCGCGATLPDNTDCISYKARLLADQDFPDFLEEMEAECSGPAPGKAWRYFGEIFQCGSCGNLIIFPPDGTARCDFQPVEQEHWQWVTRSYLGEGWKGILRGHYWRKSEAGEVFWYTNGDQGLLTGLSLQETRRLYGEKFDELRSRGVLQSSFMRIDGEEEHLWSRDG